MRKYIILIVALLINLCMGAAYSWSTFVPALKESYGLTIAQTQVIFGTGSLAATILIFLGGRIQDRFGPRIPAFLGGILFGASYIMAGYSSGSYQALLLFIGILAPAGVGLCYLAPISCAVKWFPDHKSLATGIAVAGYGGSAIIISQLGEHLLARQLDVLSIFRYLGFGFIGILAVTTLFLNNPPRAANDQDLPTKINTLSLFKDRKFLGLLCGIFPGLCAGLMVIGNVKPFGLSLNIGAAVAGAAVTILALFNTCGRLIWGFLGSVLEGKKAILISLVSTAFVILAAPFAINSSATFYFFAMMAGFNYSSCLVLYAAEVAHQYGTEKMATVYSTLFLCNGVAGFVSPPLAGKIFDATGTYTPAFLLFGALSLASVFLFHFIYKPEKPKSVEAGIYPPRL